MAQNSLSVVLVLCLMMGTGSCLPINFAVHVASKTKLA
jgi:hypothetical protein